MPRFNPHPGCFPSEAGNRLKSGFTLIELLVVVAIIGILAALMFPALAAAKARAKRAQCINNVHQLSLIWVMYAGDNADKLVPNGSVPAGGNPLAGLWIQGAFFNPADNYNSALMLDPKYSLFAPYLKSASTYVCPADRLNIRVNNQNYPKLRSYGLNAWMGWTGAWDTRLGSPVFFKVFRKTGEIPRPSHYFTFQDVQPDSICWPYFGVTMTGPGLEKIFNFPAVHHNKGGIMGFADGHVEGRRWRDPRTIAAKSSDYHAHADSSPGNKDIAWLVERTTMINPDWR